MATIENTSYNEFKKSAGSYFRATKEDNDLDAATNGHKCLSLMYLGHGDDWTEREINEAVIVLELASNRLMEIEAQ